MKTLQDYHTDFQRLVHDSSYRYWTVDEVTAYINKARMMTAADTGCTRTLIQNVPIPAGVSAYAFSTLQTRSVVVWNNDQGQSAQWGNDAGQIATWSFISDPREVFDILDVLLVYGTNTRTPLRFYEYSQFARSYEYLYRTQGTPGMYTIYNQTVLIASIPVTDFTADFDAVLVPVDLSALTDQDNDIVRPFTECIGFYAAYLAKLADQRRDEANNFYVDYVKRRMQVNASAAIRRLVGA